MRILWAVSSVGKGHLIRDIAIVQQLQKMADVDVDWLAPDPAGTFLAERGYHVLDCSTRLAGSGKAYAQVFRHCTDEFNLVDYIRKDTSLQMRDFRISAEAWSHQTYDVIVGDEAFWLLTGFCARPAAKPAPFVFLTDFIGIKALRFRLRDIFMTWYQNFRFAMSYLGPDVYVYIGSAEEIPDERLGFLLPGRRRWAQQHCRFVRPIVSFDPNHLGDKKGLRRQLGLPEDGLLFLATVGPEGNYQYRREQIEKIFERLREAFGDARFILVTPERGSHNWIDYHRYLENLYVYFAAADFAFIQSGYGKAVELSALGIPFVAIPLDYHFEQEYVMAHRLRHYSVGSLVTLRDHSLDEIAQEVKVSLQKEVHRVPVDLGAEVGRLIVETAQRSWISGWARADDPN